MASPTVPDKRPIRAIVEALHPASSRNVGKARSAQRDHREDLDGTGVTVNVLIPGGITNIPMASDKTGFVSDAVLRQVPMDCAGRVRRSPTRS
jgi:hypothetical protein